MTYSYRQHIFRLLQCSYKYLCIYVCMYICMWRKLKPSQVTVKTNISKRILNFNRVFIRYLQPSKNVEKLTNAAQLIIVRCFWLFWGVRRSYGECARPCRGLSKKDFLQSSRKPEKSLERRIEKNSFRIRNCEVACLLTISSHA